MSLQKTMFVIAAIILMANVSCMSDHSGNCTFDRYKSDILKDHPYLILDTIKEREVLEKKIPYLNATLSRTKFSEADKMNFYDFHSVFDDSFIGSVLFICDKIYPKGRFVYTYCDLRENEGTDSLTFTVFTASPPYFESKLTVAEVNGNTGQEEELETRVINEHEPLVVIYKANNLRQRDKFSFRLYLRSQCESHVLKDSIELVIDFKNCHVYEQRIKPDTLMH